MNLVSWRITEVVWLSVNLFFSADRPLECEMLMCREQTCKVINIALGRFETFFSWLKKSVVSLIKLFAFWAQGFKQNSAYCEIFFGVGQFVRKNRASRIIELVYFR